MGIKRSVALRKKGEYTEVAGEGGGMSRRM